MGSDAENYQAKPFRSCPFTGDQLAPRHFRCAACALTGLFCFYFDNGLWAGIVAGSGLPRRGANSDLVASDMNTSQEFIKGVIRYIVTWVAPTTLRLGVSAVIYTVAKVRSRPWDSCHSTPKFAKRSHRSARQVCVRTRGSKFAENQTKPTPSLCRLRLCSLSENCETNPCAQRAGSKLGVQCSQSSEIAKRSHRGNIRTESSKTSETAWITRVAEELPNEPIAFSAVRGSSLEFKVWKTAKRSQCLCPLSFFIQPTSEQWALLGWFRFTKRTHALGTPVQNSEFKVQSCRELRNIRLLQICETNPTRNPKLQIRNRSRELPNEAITRLLEGALWGFIPRNKEVTEF